jgi:hypothetical protein
MKNALRFFSVVFALAGLQVTACGGPDKKPETAGNDTPSNPEMPPKDSPDDGEGGAPESTPQDKKDKVCQGLELDLASALGQAACEVQVDPNRKPVDMKGKLEVKVVPLMTTVPSGKRTDLVISFTNKLPSSIDLDFVVDPLPRFTVEAYDAKTNKRVDMPAGNPPPPPKNAKRPDPAKPSIARVTVVANGTAKIVIPWDAVKTKWAPEKYAGTPPEMGFPRVPAGGLPKGKYRLKVVTPLTNVFEGIDKEVSAPKVDIAVQ